LFCKNQQNYETALACTDTDPQPYYASLKKIDKSWLVTDVNKANYVPQIDDVVLYFWQGHEDYIYQYNCHFYAGQQAAYPKHQTMPWFSPKTRKLVTQMDLVLCKVVSVQTLFPSQRSLRLITLFGTEASDYQN
jgi:hypothetical protein